MRYASLVTFIARHSRGLVSALLRHGRVTGVLVPPYCRQFALLVCAVFSVAPASVRRDSRVLFPPAPLLLSSSSTTASVAEGASALSVENNSGGGKINFLPSSKSKRRQSDNSKPRFVNPRNHHCLFVIVLVWASALQKKQRRKKGTVTLFEESGSSSPEKTTVVWLSSIPPTTTTVTTAKTQTRKMSDGAGSSGGEPLSIVQDSSDISAADDVVAQRVFKVMANPNKVNFGVMQKIAPGAVLPSRKSKKGSRSNKHRNTTTTTDAVRPIDVSAVSAAGSKSNNNLGTAAQAAPWSHEEVATPGEIGDMVMMEAEHGAYGAAAADPYYYDPHAQQHHPSHMAEAAREGEEQPHAPFEGMVVAEEEEPHAAPPPSTAYYQQNASPTRPPTAQQEPRQQQPPHLEAHIRRAVQFQQPSPHTHAPQQQQQQAISPPPLSSSAARQSPSRKPASPQQQQQRQSPRAPPMNGGGLYAPLSAYGSPSQPPLPPQSYNAYDNSAVAEAPQQQYLYYDDNEDYPINDASYQQQQQQQRPSPSFSRQPPLQAQQPYKSPFMSAYQKYLHNDPPSSPSGTGLPQGVAAAAGYQQPRKPSPRSQQPQQQQYADVSSSAAQYASPSTGPFQQQQQPESMPPPLPPPRMASPAPRQAPPPQQQQPRRPANLSQATAAAVDHQEERRIKQTLLLEMERMEKLGHTFSRRFTYDDPIPDMEYEIEMKRINDRHAASVAGLMETGKSLCTGLAIANEKIGPFLNLDGDDENNNFLDKIDPFFDKHKSDIEALYQQYFKRGPGNPLFNILSGLVGLIFMTHFKNTYSRYRQKLPAGSDPQQQQPYKPDYRPQQPPPGPYYHHQQQQPFYAPGAPQPNMMYGMYGAPAAPYQYHQQQQQQHHQYAPPAPAQTWDTPVPYGRPDMAAYNPYNMPMPPPQQQQQWGGPMYMPGMPMVAPPQQQMMQPGMPPQQHQQGPAAIPPAAPGGYVPTPGPIMATVDANADPDEPVGDIPELDTQRA